MTIRGGQLVTIGRDVFVRRLQSTNPALNLPTETIRELGNGHNVAVIRDVPDLSYDLESLDTTTDFEALLTRVDPTTTVAGQEFSLENAQPIDVIDAFRAEKLTTSIRGIVLPSLYLDGATYRFGVGANSTQRFTLRGDSVLFTPGTPYYQRFVPGGSTGPFNFAHGPALVFHDAGVPVYALSACLYHTDGTWSRLSHGDDYTDTNGHLTLTTAPASGDILEVTYASATVRDLSGAETDTTAVQPATVRGKDIDVYVSDGAATPTLVRWRGLQSAEITWGVNAEVTNELGNDHSVERDYDQANVTGTLTMRPSTVQYLFDRIAQIADVPSNEVVGALSSQPLELRIVINHPDTTTPIKTFVIDDARFTPPIPPGQVNQRTEVPFAFTSDEGHLRIVKGAAA